MKHPRLPLFYWESQNKEFYQLMADVVSSPQSYPATLQRALVEQARPRLIGSWTDGTPIYGHVERDLKPINVTTDNPGSATSEE